MVYTTEQISREICRRLGIKIPSGVSSGHVMVSCPKHVDKTPSLSIDLSKNLLHCFSCGWGGTLRSAYYNEFGHGILKDLGIRGDDVEQSESTYEERNFDDLPEVSFRFNGSYVPAETHQFGKKFLESRGFDKTIAQKYGMRFVVSGRTYNEDEPDNKSLQINFKNRVIIPIYENGTMISLEGRDVFGKEQWRKDLTAAGLNPDEHVFKKVLYPKGSSVNSLYGLDKLDTKAPLYAVEGLMDLIALRTSDVFKNSTAYFGAQITQRQLHLLDRFDNIIFIPNRDQAGLMTIKKVMSSPSIWRKCSILWPPNGYSDVNEILQKKGRIISVQDALDKGWLSKIIAARDFDYDLFKDLFEKSKKA